MTANIGFAAQINDIKALKIIKLNKMGKKWARIYLVKKIK